MTTLKKTLLMAVALTLTVVMVAPARAQDTASIQGHANDELGTAIHDGEVKLTKDITEPPDKRVFTYAFKTDADGNYKGTGIQPGTYDIVLFRQGKSVDFVEDPKDAVHALAITLKLGDTQTFNFDMTRASFLATLSPERKKEIEEYKAKNSSAVNANKVIQQLNATLKTVHADMEAAKPTSGDVSKDVDAMKQATDAKPDESLLWITYGETLAAQGDHLGHEDIAQHKPVITDDETMKVYNNAVDSLKKGIDLNAASKKPAPSDQAVAYNQMGNVLAKQHKPQDAVSAFESAAKLDPPKAGTYYGNEAAILANNNATKEAGAAADKAIAADPNRPDPYYIKGQSLIGDSTIVNGKMQAPPGCVEAYQKYLELAPDGKFAPSVKEVLASLGQTVVTRYKAGKK